MRGVTSFLGALGRWSPAVRLRTRCPFGALNAAPLLLASPDRPFFLLLDARAEGGAAAFATRPRAFELLAPAWDELRQLEPDAALRRCGELIQAGNQAVRGARVYASAACWAPGRALVVLTRGALLALGGPETWAADPVAAFDACTGWAEQDAALVRFDPSAAREGRA